MRTFKEYWCRLTHPRTDRNIAYAGGAEWYCRRCGCRFPVPWAIPLDDPPKEPDRHESKLISLSVTSL